MLKSTLSSDVGRIDDSRLLLLLFDLDDSEVMVDSRVTSSSGKDTFMGHVCRLLIGSSSFEHNRSG